MSRPDSTASGIPLQRAGILRPFIDTLFAQGSPVESGLSRAKLPERCLEDPSCLVSTQASLAFIFDMGTREGIEDFGWIVGARAGVGSLSATLLTRVRHAPTLFQALKTVCALANQESSHVTLWIEGSDAGIYLCERSSFAPGSLPGADEITLWRSRTLIEIIRIFTGPDWSPPGVGLAVQSGLSARVGADLPDTRIQATREFSWHFLPSSMLSCPCRADQRHSGDSPGRKEESPATDLAGSLSQLIRPYLEQANLSIDLIAEVAGTSRRTLQRRLAESGLRYSDLLDRVRYDAAVQMLEDPTVRITDAAFALGYEDSSNFARAFKRIAGVSPRAYRRLHVGA